MRQISVDYSTVDFSAKIQISLIFKRSSLRSQCCQMIRDFPKLWFFFFFAVSTNGFQRSTTVAQSFSLYSTNPQSIEDVVQPELLQTNNASSSNSGTLMHHNLNMLQHSNNNNIHTASSNNGMMMTMMSGAQDRNFRRRRRRKQIFWKR